MPPHKTTSGPALRSGMTLSRVILAVAFTLGIIRTSCGQTSSRKPGSDARQAHWCKYVNQEFHFSFWYPSTYVPTSGDEVCKDNNYRRFLLCLERANDPDTSVTVTLIIGEPFRVHPLGNGDELPPRQRIGHHDFYCGVGGSMGVGITDECLFNLRGKTLKISFAPSQTVNSSDAANSIVFKSLCTFRLR